MRGILFFNDEGTENGGLGGGGIPQGRQVISVGHLSFDQYEQDQVISLDQGEENGRRIAGLTFSDRPDTPLPVGTLLDKQSKAEARAELERLDKSGGFGYSRLFIGKTTDRDSTVVLKDAKGRARLVMKVQAEGSATIEFLDEAGKVVRTLTPEAEGKSKTR